MEALRDVALKVKRFLKRLDCSCEQSIDEFLNMVKSVEYRFDQVGCLTRIYVKIVYDGKLVELEFSKNGYDAIFITIHVRSGIHHIEVITTMDCDEYLWKLFEYAKEFEINAGGDCDG